jgi:hypothetical protein
MKKKSFKVRLYEKVHKQPYETDELVDIQDIILPRVMKNSTPALWKVDNAMEFLKKHGYVDKPILVEKITNEKGKPNKFLLVDSYTRYLAIKSQRYTKVPVKYVNEL